MKLIILSDYDAASEWAAKYIRNKIIRFKPGPDRFFTLGLPTGTLYTPAHLPCSHTSGLKGSLHGEMVLQTDGECVVTLYDSTL